MHANTGSLPKPILDIVTAARELERAELTEAARIEADRIVALVASGDGDLDESFALEVPFRLVYVRGHFTGTAGTAKLELGVESQHGSRHDTLLQTIDAVGPGADVHLACGGAEAARPSAWSFQPGDAVRLRWSNSGGVTWGVEVGLAPA